MRRKSVVGLDLSALSLARSLQTACGAPGSFQFGSGTIVIIFQQYGEAGLTLYSPCLRVIMVYYISIHNIYQFSLPSFSAHERVIIFRLQWHAHASLVMPSSMPFVFVFSPLCNPSPPYYDTPADHLSAGTRCQI